MDSPEKLEIRGDVRPADNGIYYSGNANSKQSHGDGALSVAATKKLWANDRIRSIAKTGRRVVVAGKLRRLQ